MRLLWEMTRSWASPRLARDAVEAIARTHVLAHSHGQTHGEDLTALRYTRRSDNKGIYQYNSAY